MHTHFAVALYVRGLNGEDYCAVKLKSNEHMTIGYLKRKGVALSLWDRNILEEIRKYKAMGMDIRGRGRYKSGSKAELEVKMKI